MKQVSQHMAARSSINVYFSLLTQFNSNEEVNLPTKFRNKNKNYSYFLSRYALYTNINKQIEFSKIELINFQKILNYPDFIFSLAHTKVQSDHAALAMRADENNFLGVGCDIEWLERVVPENSAKFFMNEHDQYTGSLLELWCLKEACFKALFNAGTPIKLLKEVVLSKTSFRFINDQNFSSLNTFKIIKHHQFLLVLAFCAKLSQEIELIEIK